MSSNWILQVVAAGETVDDVMRLLEEATTDLLDDLRRSGKPVPEPQTLVRTIEFA